MTNQIKDERGTIGAKTMPPKTRTFLVTKTYAEDSREPDLEYFSEARLLCEPIHPFIKECIKNHDFHHFQIGYFTHVTDITLVS